MRSKVVRTLALALLLGGVGIVLGQAPRTPQELLEGQGKAKSSPKRKVIRVEEEEESPKRVIRNEQPKKSKLEEMLAEALKNNPDIRVAAAKLAEADAELNRTRLQVTQKVAMLYHAIETQKKFVELAEAKYKRYQGLFQGRSIDEKLADEKQQELALAKAKLAELEAQAPALLGKTAHAEADAAAQEATVKRALGWIALQQDDTELSRIKVRLWDARTGKEIQQRLQPGPMAERIRKALQTPIKANYDMTLDDILSDLAKKVPGLSFRNLVSAHATEKIHLRFEEALPVSAILQALADETRCLFYVREYGILATHVLCPGAITVEEFLRQKPAQATTPAGAASRDGMMWKPPENIVGTIKEINQHGTLSIAFNTVDGLLNGHMLYVYRPSDAGAKPKYLGTVRLTNVQGKDLEPQNPYSYAAPIGQFTESPKVGDRVTGHAPEK